MCLYYYRKWLVGIGRVGKEHDILAVRWRLYPGWIFWDGKLKVFLESGEVSIYSCWYGILAYNG